MYNYFHLTNFKDFNLVFNGFENNEKTTIEMNKITIL